MDDLFRLAARAPPLRIVRVGRSDEPVAVLDDVFADAGAIVDAVARSGGFRGAAEGGYPGLQTTAPSAYSRALLAAADAALEILFGRSGGAIGGISCAFSMVTLPPARLHPLQTVPHIDIAEPDRFAILHYLCGPPFGGTAFYRQDTTGLEQIARADWAAYEAARDASLNAAGAKAYPSEATPGYTMTAQIPARMNRILVYRSNMLHSGIVPAGMPHPMNPGHGRLTGNLFAIYRTA